MVLLHFLILLNLCAHTSNIENAMEMKNINHAVIFNPLGKLSIWEFTPKLELFIVFIPFIGRLLFNSFELLFPNVSIY